MKTTVRLGIILSISFSFFLVELAFGFKTRSLALISDAFHYLNDILSYAIAFAAAYLQEHGQRSSSYTYAFHRAELVGAFFNGVFLLALALSIFLQSIERFVHLEKVEDPLSVIIVGGVGLALNIVSAIFAHDHGGHSHGHGGHSHGADEEEHLHPSTSGHVCGPVSLSSAGHSHGHGAAHAHGHSHHEATKAKPRARAPSASSCHVPATLASARHGCGTGPNGDEVDEEYPEVDWHALHNHTKLPPPVDPHGNLGMFGVFIHVVGDAVNNIGVMISGLIILKAHSPNRFYADPAISMAIALIIFASAIPLTKRSGRILLEAAPEYLDVQYIQEDLLTLPNVLEVHDLHVWHLSQSFLLASLSVACPPGSLEDWSKTEAMIRHCFNAYGISHVTVSPLVKIEQGHAGHERHDHDHAGHDHPHAHAHGETTPVTTLVDAPAVNKPDTTA